MVKCCLKLDSGIQVPDFEAIEAHSAIVMVRYIFMAIEERLAIDQMTIGALCHAASEELRDIVITELFVLCLSTDRNKARDWYARAEQILILTIEICMKAASVFIRPDAHTKCERWASDTDPTSGEQHKTPRDKLAVTHSLDRHAYNMRMRTICQ
jgi:hypothetical protein